MNTNRGEHVLPQGEHALFRDTRARAADSAGKVLLERVHAPSDIGEEIGKMAQEGVEETVSDEVFVSYKHQEIIAGCKAHPGDIVEASSLSALEPPEVTYPLKDSLPRQLIASGALSSLQLSGILYACQRHQLQLPNGCRAGFFLGDAAGVGKGRQISGIILDNLARKRTKHIWFSIASDLIFDARRDLEDIGCYVKVIEGCQQLDRETRVFGLPTDFKEGVIFNTYATLVSSVQKGGAFNTSRQSRLQQLIDWCGGATFDGCLIFDECHKAKNFVPGKDESSTKVALAVTSIQRMLPKARVVYCSATGVTDVKNMAFMERLGLWGEGATFKSFEEFIDTVQRKGLGIAEMLAMEMKSSGMYLSRGLSFKQTQFDTVEISLSQEQIKMYNVAAHLWHEVKKSLDHALDRCGVANNRVWSSFWAAHQRFFKQLCMGIKIPSIVAMTTAALASDQCVVIGLQTTGEASMDVELTSGGGKVTGFVSICREILKRFIQQHFPTVVEGKTSNQGGVEDEWSVTAKEMLLGFVEQIKLPNSPLDELIDQLGGPGAVAEMTGRKGRIVRHSPHDKPQYESRGSEASKEMESLNVAERNEFMEGKKFVAIISDAASTGISLHADARVTNQRRRVHVTLELPWSADKAVQQMGRSHRSNQSSGPLYKLLTTNLGGERRFAAAVARRLQSLGALTKGDRRAASGADLGEFNFDTPYGRQALRNMYAAICQKHLANGVSLHSLTKGQIEFAQFNQCMLECLDVMGLLEASTLSSAQKVKDGLSSNVGTFLNRILGLKVEKQNLIFNYFTKCLEALVSMAKKEGRYNEGLVDIAASSVVLLGKPREIFKQKNKTNNPTFHKVVEIDRGMSWEKAVTRLENHPGEENGFYCSRRDVRGRRLYLLATLKENSTHLFKIARPSTGVSAFDEERTDLNNKYIPISKEKAEAGWREQYKTSRMNCIHGANCRNGPTCNVGARCYQMHLLCGGIVTLMSLLETTLSKYGPKVHLTKSESNLRVVRVQLNSGERVVGVRYPQVLIPIAEREFSEQSKITQFLYSQQQLFHQQQQQQRICVEGTLKTLTSPLSEGQVKVDANGDEKPVAKFVVEDVTPVNDRSLQKATTPPVTIRNFFKPLTKNKEEEEGEKEASEKSSDTSHRSVEDMGCKNEDENDLESKVKLNGCGLRTDYDVSGLGNESVESGMKCARLAEGNCNTGVDSKIGAFTVGSISTKTSSLKQHSTGSSSSGGLQRKRTLPSSSKTPASKKSKNQSKGTQSSIFASFAKVKSNQEKQQQESLTCPICSKEFERGTSNADVNAHVDSCLIE